MSKSFYIRLGILGLVFYGLFNMIFKQNEQTGEYVEESIDFMATQKENDQNRETSFATLLANVDELGLQDENLIACIKRELQFYETKFKYEKITDPTVLKQLDCSRRKIKVLYGLEKFQALETLRLAGNKLDNIRPIGKLEKLKTLDLSLTGITSIWPIVHLKVEKLNLSGVRLDDNRDLLKLNALKELDYIIQSDYECDSLDKFFRAKDRNGWYVKRPSTCLDQYGKSTRF